MGALWVRGGPLLAGPDQWWPRGLLIIEHGEVTFAGEDDGRLALPGVEVLEAEGGLIFPGLINAHCHAAMSLFRGLADDLPLEQWLNDHIFPAEALWVSPEMVEACALLAAGEMLLAGITTVGDAYFCQKGALRAFGRAGLRAVLCQGLIDFPAPGVPDPAQGLAECRRFLELAQDSGGPLITAGIFAHSPYTCSPRTLAGAAELAAELAAPLFIHLAETQTERLEIEQRYGSGPALHLQETGVLSQLTAAVHGVWLDRSDLEILAGEGVALVHCPEANAKLASGLARVEDWLAAGLAVGIGTDGPASNNDLDLLGEVHTAALQAKLASGRAEALPAPRALDLAWQGGAAALGLADRVGRLGPGRRADLVILTPGRPHLTPLYDPFSALVYSARAGDVRHVLIEGKLVVKDRRVLSFDLAAAQRRIDELAARVRRG